MKTTPRIDVSEVQWTAIRAQGAGGQNVNKVSSAVHLRFDVRASSLPDATKARLMESSDQRMTADGIVVIKAQRHRTQERNLDDAMARLQAFVDAVGAEPASRIATRPSKSARRRRVESKLKRGETKASRAKVVE